MAKARAKSGSRGGKARPSSANRGKSSSNVGSNHGAFVRSSGGLRSTRGSGRHGKPGPKPTTPAASKTATGMAGNLNQKVGRGRSNKGTAPHWLTGKARPTLTNHPGT